MQINNLVQSEIEEKWSVTPRVNSPIHKANMVLMPSNWECFDLFLLRAENKEKKGIENVSYMIESVLEHKDNIGHEGILRTGDLFSSLRAFFIKKYHGTFF